jgi:hypothetical protein
MRHRDRSRTSSAIQGLIAAVLLASAAGTVSAASVNVDLDQWASSAKAWQNGNLNGNNSRYPEGGVVPFRLAIEGLQRGEHSIHINYDFTAGGHKAYDFLATWDVTNAKGRICGSGGGAVSSMCPNLPAPSSAAFPSDSYRANGLSVKGAEAYSGSPRRLTIWGGTVTSISAQDHSGSPNGNATADIVVRFRSTGSAVLLAWGGHLAQSAYWDSASGGARDGASLVSGAPWHMRTLKLDGSGNRNQDRSIQPSAIVGELPPQGLAPTPRPTSPGSSPTDPPAGPHTPTAAGPPRPGLTPPATTTGAPPTTSARSAPSAVLFAGMALILILAVILARRFRATPPSS